MNRIKAFIKKEIVLVIAALLAIASAFLVPPCAAYADYIDFRVLALLFCLMAVVAGFKKIGLFDAASDKLTAKVKSTKGLAFVLVNLCFFFSMFVTNDVALITFVPLTIGLLSAFPSTLILVVVMETVAANLGSMLTPIGNPQNLFLYSFYDMGIGEFFSLMLPVGALSYVLIAAVLLFMKKEPISRNNHTSSTKISKPKLLEFSVLFVLCLLTVLNIVHYLICLAAVIIVLLIFDRDIFKCVDYMLLLTFTAIFIFVGNIGSLDAVRGFVSGILGGNELIVGALFSQGISNVPTAVMLSSFTENGKGLLLGVDIGGLGTLVASLASLISYKLYSNSPNAEKGKFMLVFTIVNFAFLAVMLTAGYFYHFIV